jgi:hypothetical protein
MKCTQGRCWSDLIHPLRHGVGIRDAKEEILVIVDLSGLPRGLVQVGWRKDSARSDRGVPDRICVCVCVCVCVCARVVVCMVVCMVVVVAAAVVHA